VPLVKEESDSNCDDLLKHIKEQTRKASKLMSNIERKREKLESDIKRMTKAK
jgi:hypothetical protein